MTNENPDSSISTNAPTVTPHGSSESTTSSSSTSRLGVIALVIALMSISLAGYASWRVSEMDSQVEGVDSIPEDLDLFMPPSNLPDLIAEVEQSVVSIFCGGSVGTGFSFEIDAEEPGFSTVLVTNFHVIEECVDDPSQLSIFTNLDGDVEPAVIVRGIDEDADLALLEIDAELPFLENSETFASPGWWTMAIGNPYDEDFEEVLYNSTTFGQISHVLDSFWNYTSATINGGNSGGPLINSRGRVIGINTLAAASTEGGVWNLAVDTDALCEKLVECD